MEKIMKLYYTAILQNVEMTDTFFSRKRGCCDLD